jgi:hypothetical protein
MLSVENQTSWMPSRIGGAQFAAQELALDAPKEAPPKKEFSLFGEDGFTFADLIDVVNPLQHIPLISTFYREASGDQIAPGPRVLGSTLFFGPIGFAGAMANVMVEESTGKDIGEHMASWITPEPATATADASAADIAYTPAFTQDSGQQDPIIGPGDPIIAWARNEIDWARQNAQVKKPDSRADTKASTPAVAGDPSVPDASRWVRQQQPIQPGPIDLAQSVVLNSDLRSAAWAYESAANLRS